MQVMANRGSGDVFGLYELTDSGTVLYSRSRTEEGLRAPNQEFVGQDFFRDVAPFENTEDLRRHFRQFIAGARSVDAFVFDGFSGSEVIRTKVLMTRAFETDHDHAAGIVIMDIRRAA